MTCKLLIESIVYNMFNRVKQTILTYFSVVWSMKFLVGLRRTSGIHNRYTLHLRFLTSLKYGIDFVMFLDKVVLSTKFIKKSKTKNEKKVIIMRLN
jgi:hypothetical protein